jgi:hypothetical protein
MTIPATVQIPIEPMDSALVTTPQSVRLEPRCRVCRNDKGRLKVNGMLAAGYSYAMIVRALEDDNSKLVRNERITIDSVRNHTLRHFPVQQVARATYREVLERRAEENGVDFVEGVATAITPMALYETVMMRGYESLIDPETKVDLNTAMTAAARLQALVAERSEQPDMVDIMVKQNRIIRAMREVVPEELWPEIVQRLEEPASFVAHHDEAVDPGVEDDDEEYDPMEFAEPESDDC